MKKVLVIGGLDVSGGAGIGLDERMLASIGHHVSLIPTAIVAENSEKVSNIYPVPEEVLEGTFESVLQDIRPDAVKIGMLYSTKIGECVLRNIPSGIPVVMDPVLGSSTGTELSKPDLPELLREKFFYKTTMVTPNLPEARVLLGMSQDDAPVEEILKVIKFMGPKHVLLKGGHMDDEMSIDYLFDGIAIIELKAPRLDVKARGTGCALSSLIAGYLAEGSDVENAVRKAKNQLYCILTRAQSIGGGMPFLGLPQPRNEVLEELESASVKLVETIRPAFFPQVGINFGYAAENAAGHEDVAALDARFMLKNGKPYKAGSAAFGASKHIASVILAARTHDPSIRSACNIRYSKESIERLNIHELEVAQFSRQAEPRDKKTSTMEWGTLEAIKNHGSVPDAIYDHGGPGKEPMIRLLGKDPEEVIQKLKDAMRG